MKEANKEVFEPRGLVVKIMNTKKMMGAVGCGNFDAKGKLALPPLEVLDDLTPPTSLVLYQSGASGSDEGKVELQVEDPRMRRLNALEGFIAPLEFEKEGAPARGVMDKYGGAPLRWLNKRQDTKLQKAAEKSVEHRRKHSYTVEEEFRGTELEMAGIEERMRDISINAEKELEVETGQERRYEVEARIDSELAELKGRKEQLERGRDKRVREVYNKGDKKLEKLARKEKRIANRILWIVITRMDESEGDELVDVGSISS